MIIIKLILSVKVNDGCSLSVKFNKLRKGGCRLRSINKISVGQVQYGYIRSRSIVRIRTNEILAVGTVSGCNDYTYNIAIYVVLPRPEVMKHPMY